MDKKEALQILSRVLEGYRAEPYDTLVNLIDGEPVTMEETGPSGQRYQLEIQAVWNGRHGGPVRVFGSIDDGGWRALSPLTDCFIKSPSGEFLFKD